MILLLGLQVTEAILYSQSNRFSLKSTLCNNPTYKVFLNPAKIKNAVK